MNMRYIPIALVLGGCATLSPSSSPYWDIEDDTGWGWKTTKVVYVDKSPYSKSILAWTTRNPESGICTIYMTRRTHIEDHDRILGHEYLHCLGLNHRSQPQTMSFSWAPTSIFRR